MPIHLTIISSRCRHCNIREVPAPRTHPGYAPLFDQPFTDFYILPPSRLSLHDQRRGKALTRVIHICSLSSIQRQGLSLTLPLIQICLFVSSITSAPSCHEARPTTRPTPPTAYTSIHLHDLLHSLFTFNPRYFQSRFSEKN